MISLFILRSHRLDPTGRYHYCDLREDLLLWALPLPQTRKFRGQIRFRDLAEILSMTSCRCRPADGDSSSEASVWPWWIAVCKESTLDSTGCGGFSCVYSGCSSVWRAGNSLGQDKRRVFPRCGFSGGRKDCAISWNFSNTHGTHTRTPKSISCSQVWNIWHIWTSLNLERANFFLELIGRRRCPLQKAS